MYSAYIFYYDVPVKRHRDQKKGGYVMKLKMVGLGKMGLNLAGSLTLAHGQNSQMSFMYGFFFVKFLFFTVVCVVIMI